ncbi:hypothetical protein LguiB_005580 [Lonicera macranthoides]
MGNISHTYQVYGQSHLMGWRDRRLAIVGNDEEGGGERGWRRWLIGLNTYIYICISTHNFFRERMGLGFDRIKQSL